MAECNWDPKKHGGRPCPKHGNGGLWDENVFARKEKLKKAGYEDADLEDEDLKEDFDGDYEEEFVENIDNIDYDKAEENEKINANKARKPDGSLSEEAFKVGQDGAKKYLDYMTQYNDLDKLKGSNIFLGGLQSAVSKAITEAGYNPNFELTYKDFNDVVGSVLGEEVDYEEYERNATKGFTGKKYQNKDGFNDDNSDINDTEIDYENIEYPKGTSKEYTMVANKKYQDALPVLEKAGIKLEDFSGKASAEGGYEDNSKEIMDKYVFEPFRKKYPRGNNDAWEKEYQPLYDAIDSVLDKRYNDWWIRNRGK